VNVWVGPVADRTVVEAVTRAGGRVADEPAHAEAIVWLGYDPPELEPHLHDGVTWVQLAQAGVNRWLAAGLIDARRTWTSAAGAFGEVVGERATALLLAGVHRLPEHARSRRWTRHRGGSVAGSRVLVVGTGAIGQAVAHRLRALGSEAVGCNRDGRRVPPFAAVHAITGWPAPLAGVDHVVLAAPSTPQTRKLLDAAALAALPSHAVVVNVARGDLVDTDALVAALTDGALGGAALDVTDPEPLPEGHPLWELPAALVSSHTANPQPERTAHLAAHVGVNVARWVAGQPLHGIIDPARGY
jgi:D-3-phosphoglycerate dehydrogenase